MFVLTWLCMPLMTFSFAECLPAWSAHLHVYFVFMSFYLTVYTLSLCHSIWLCVLTLYVTFYLTMYTLSFCHSTWLCVLTLYVTFYMTVCTYTFCHSVGKSGFCVHSNGLLLWCWSGFWMGRCFASSVGRSRPIKYIVFFCFQPVYVFLIIHLIWEVISPPYQFHTL